MSVQLAGGLTYDRHGVVWPLLVRRGAVIDWHGSVRAPLNLTLEAVELRSSYGRTRDAGKALRGVTLGLWIAGRQFLSVPAVALVHGRDTLRPGGPAIAVTVGQEIVVQLKRASGRRAWPRQRLTLELRLEFVTLPQTNALGPPPACAGDACHRSEKPAAPTNPEVTE